MSLLKRIRPPTKQKKGGDGEGVGQDQQQPETLERPEVTPTINSIDAVLKKTKHKQRSPCGC